MGAVVDKVVGPNMVAMLRPTQGGHEVGRVQARFPPRGTPRWRGAMLSHGKPVEAAIPWTEITVGEHPRPVYCRRQWRAGLDPGPTTHVPPRNCPTAAPRLWEAPNLFHRIVTRDADILRSLIVGAVLW